MNILKRLAFILVVSVLIINVTPVYAKTKGVDVKVVSVKNTTKSIKVKVKIRNNSKKSVEYGNYFDLYQRKGGKK